ncbi:hypothetical protein LINPERPRIM_LOCUS354 [Linum perenne]
MVSFFVVKEEPKLSHIFFADDLVLFEVATRDQCDIISQCLERFCAASGQLVSKEKSHIFFSKNTSFGMRRNIC